jgi:cation:H+ antiporter
MLLAIGLLAAGTVVLTVGAEAAIRAAGRVTKARGISPFVLGAVLFGIDLESLGAAVIAAARDQTSIAAGEAFGTIVFLFGVGFGLALFLARGPVESPSRAMVLWPAATLVLGALAVADEAVTRYEAVSLVLAYVLYLWMVLREREPVEAVGEHVEREAEEMRRVPPVVLLIGGLALVYAGATMMVDGGIRILDRTGLAAGFVGAALIGGLASADEVLLAILPIRRGMTSLATGNLFGTVAAFSTLVLGLAALVRPLVVDSAAASAFLAASLLYTIVATAFLMRGRAGKLVGVALIVVYAAWLAFSSQI